MFILAVFFGDNGLNAHTDATNTPNNVHYEHKAAVNLCIIHFCKHHEIWDTVANWGIPMCTYTYVANAPVYCLHPTPCSAREFQTCARPSPDNKPISDLNQLWLNWNKLSTQTALVRNMYCDLFLTLHVYLTSWIKLISEN